jgi:hypothetical protein
LGFDKRVEQLRRDTSAQETPIVLIAVEGNPDANELHPMVSPREAMIGDDYHRAEEGESVASFHTRLKKIYRETGAKGVIVLGDASNAVEPAPSIFNVDGGLIEPPPGDATRH